MDEYRYVLIVAVMALATYPLRLIPALLVSHLKFSTYLRRVFRLIPYTALTALVFPGIIFSLEEHVYIAAAGALCAALCALIKLPLSATVILTVCGVYVLLLL
ncbi:MAG: AzlD domain-containing protein [Succinivibrio sp.]|nr:AzlD domain-containing protein [Succinivibrio sp.]